MVKLTLCHGFLKNCGPLLGNIIPIKLTCMANRGVAEASPQDAITRQQIEALREIRIRFDKETSLTIHHVVRVIQIHGNAGKTAGAGLQQDLRIPFQNTGEEKDIRVTHFLAELFRRQVSKKRYVATAQLLCQVTAISFRFAFTRDSKLQAGQSGSFPDHQPYSLTRL